MTVRRGLAAAAGRVPSRLALRDAHRTATFAELLERVDRVAAAALSVLGLRPGDRAAIIAGNCIEYVELLAGLGEAGVPVATINPRLGAAEIIAILRDCGARVAFADERSAGAIDIQRSGVERVVLIGEELDGVLHAASQDVVLPLVHEWDTWVIPYTSGTTGEPKGVQISHRSRILTFFGQAVEYGCYSPDDRFLGFTPMSHGAGLAYPLAAVFMGGFAQLMDGFDPELVLDTLAGGAFTGVFVVPTHLHSILELPNKRLRTPVAPALRALICNAAPLSQVLKERVVASFGDSVLYETYGSTEAGVVTTLRPADQLRKKQCVGLPFPGTEVRLINVSGRPCAVGEVGELFSRSPYLFNGYWNRPEATHVTLTEDGWVSVGDLARIDDEGYYYIVDRKKDMVITGGLNVYPREVEEVLLRHSRIKEAAVIGVPDVKWGERLRAFVVTRDGEPLTVDELRQFSEPLLAAFKIPREIVRINCLPRNGSGKILKNDLRAWNFHQGTKE